MGEQVSGKRFRFSKFLVAVAVSFSAFLVGGTSAQALNLVSTVTTGYLDSYTLSTAGTLDSQTVAIGPGDQVSGSFATSARNLEDYGPASLGWGITFASMDYSLKTNANSITIDFSGEAQSNLLSQYDRGEGGSSWEYQAVVTFSLSDPTALYRYAYVDTGVEFGLSYQAIGTFGLLLDYGDWWIDDPTCQGCYSLNQYQELRRSAVLPAGVYSYTLLFSGTANGHQINDFASPDHWAQSIVSDLHTSMYVVPEPSTVLLLGFGLTVLGVARHTDDS